MTSARALAVVRASLRGRQRASSARRSAPRAVGLIGDEIGLGAAPVAELGLVGEPLPSRPAAVARRARRGA